MNAVERRKVWGKDDTDRSSALRRVSRAACHGTLDGHAGRSVVPLSDRHSLVCLLLLGGAHKRVRCACATEHLVFVSLSLFRRHYGRLTLQARQH